MKHIISGGTKQYVIPGPLFHKTQIRKENNINVNSNSRITEFGMRTDLF
jgi:hypothetical protein